MAESLAACSRAAEASCCALKSELASSSLAEHSALSSAACSATTPPRDWASTSTAPSSAPRVAMPCWYERSRSAHPPSSSARVREIASVATLRSASR
eukprot:scaffold51873_cov69-Phaeocystis_antarctica.AAC.5